MRSLQVVLPVLVAFIFVLGGCGLHQQIQAEKQAEGARETQRHLTWDIERTTRNWKDDVKSGKYKSRAEAFRALVSDLEAVHTLHGVTMDPLDRAVASYRIALLARVDRGELRQEEADYLADRMEADIALEKQRLAIEQRRLALDQQRAASEHYYRQQQIWQNVWSNYGRSYRTPVQCSIIHGPTSFVTCY